MRLLAAAAACALLGLAAGCGLDPTVLQGRACGPDHSCASGYGCDLPSGLCLPAAGSACEPEGASFPCGLDDGLCRAGVVACSGGTWQACTATTGTAETCNGLDDDCDGVTDDPWPLKDSPCQATYGECTLQGAMLCSPDGSSLLCSAQLVAGIEVCDGQDNDCDGQTDNIDQDFDTYFACPFWGALADCDDQATLIHPGASEACNDLDDDCDGATDEDFPDLGLPCSRGLGACLRTGTRVCASSTISTVCSAPLINPQDERCNGLDDDCDGQTDEDFPALGSACSRGLGICRVEGQVICSLDGLTTRCGAQPYLPQVEYCNGLDDDCDGLTDELDTDGDGYWACPFWSTSKQWDCDDTRTDVYTDAVERCDHVDNNCDEQIDEGWLGTLANCLDCGDTCQTGLAHVTTTCHSTAGCTYACQFPYFDVNGSLADGCELADDLNGAVLNNTLANARDLGTITDYESSSSYPRSANYCVGRLPRDSRPHDPAIVGPIAEDYFRLYYRDEYSYPTDLNLLVARGPGGNAYNTTIEVCVSTAVGSLPGSPTWPTCLTFNTSTAADVRFTDVLPTANQHYYIRVKVTSGAPYGATFRLRVFEKPSPVTSDWTTGC